MNKKMKTFNGNCPKNARIKIDFTHKPAEVSFSYPDKKNQISGSMFFYAFVCTFTLSLVVLLVIGTIRYSPNELSVQYVIGCYLISLVLAGLVYFPFKDKWDKFYPKWQAMIHSKRYMFFTPKSKFKDENEKYFEVPYFSNIELSYKATKEFSSLLKFIEIHEYPFYTYKIKKVKKKKKKIKRLNEFIWYARFYYKDKPSSGKLEVKFA